ncbi:hypothetical protein [Kaarinaea lacus]
MRDPDRALSFGDMSDENSGQLTGARICNRKACPGSAINQARPKISHAVNLDLLKHI